MTQAHPVPDVHARGSLAVENMASCSVALLCTRQGTNQIQLRAGIDHPSDAAQNAIYLPKCSESIDVHGHKARGLEQEFLVAHSHPRNKHVTSRGLFLGENLTQGKKNHALASSRFFTRKKWSILNTGASAKLTRAFHLQFVGESSLADGCAPVVALPPSSHVMAGAINSISIPDIVRT